MPDKIRGKSQEDEAETSDKPSPEVVKQAIRKMADRTPESILEITAAMGMGPMAHPLHQKMTEAHVGRILDLAIQHDTNEYNLKNKQQDIDSGQSRRQQYFHLTLFVILVLLLVFIIRTFQNQPAVLVPILSGIGGIVTGFLGGLGYAKSTSSETKSKS